MSHFAQLDENDMVTQVLVIEQDVIDTGAFGDPTRFVKTSYNTYGGVHFLGGTPLRKNFAGVGYKYDTELDAFIPPQAFPSWVLDKETCLWDAPVARPQDGKQYEWNESNLAWIEIHNLE